MDFQKAKGTGRRRVNWSAHITFASIIFILITSITGASKETKEQCLANHGNPVCLTSGCIHAASGVLKSIDPSVDPCDDFYQFACGTYLKETYVPDDKPLQISFSLFTDRIVDLMRFLLEKPEQPNEPKSFAFIKKFYSVCLNTSAIERDNLRTAKSALRYLGGWPVLDGLQWRRKSFDWKKTMYNLRKIGLPTSSLLSVFVGQDTLNSSRRVINCDQASFGLSREYLTKGFENGIVQAYYAYLVDVAVIFGAERKVAVKELKKAVLFEISLARIALPEEERRNLTALYNPLQVSDLQKKFPTIPWLEYINKIISIPYVRVSEHEIVEVSAPKFLIDLEALLSRTTKRVLANYIMSQAVLNLVPYLNKEMRNRELKFKAVSEGVREMKPRWKECAVNAVFSMQPAAAAMYVRKHFNEDSKDKAAELVSDLRSTFIDMLKQVDWMDEVTRAKAIDKANVMTSHVAYPQELLDNTKLEQHYSKLGSLSNNYLELALSVKRFQQNINFGKLRELVNKTEWVEHSFVTVANAFYSFTENGIQIPAGILQGILFDSERPQYMNYGALGFIIGHEITHGFDDKGRQYDKNGELREWWAEETKMAFIKKAQCVIYQYGNFTAPRLNMKLNGINTQGENIADNGGLKEAYLAYKAWVQRNGEEPRLPGLDFTPEQMFWISAANVWCSKEREEYLSLQILTDNHSPAYFRVLGSFSNSEDFARDFKCPVGSRMNPKHKCQVW